MKQTAKSSNGCYDAIDFTVFNPTLIKKEGAQMLKAQAIELLRTLIWDAAIDYSEKQELDEFLNKVKKTEEVKDD